MLHEYGACSGTFRLPAAGCTAVVEVPIGWDTVEVLPATFERCKSSPLSPHDRQVARVIPQWLAPGPGPHLLGCGTLLLLNQLLQQEPGPSGPRPPWTYSSSNKSDESKWWDDDDNDGSDYAAGGVGGDGGGGVYAEGN